MSSSGAFAVLACLVAAAAANHSLAYEWTEHILDGGSGGRRGADCIQFLNREAVSVWEESGHVRHHVQHTNGTWTTASVMINAMQPEDATIVDLDGDGTLDFAVAAEGNGGDIIILGHGHRPRMLPTVHFMDRWMHVRAAQLDGAYGPDLLIAPKTAGTAHVGWLQAPRDPWDAAGWRWHPIGEVVFARSMELFHMNDDDDDYIDVLYADRAGAFWWAQNPGPDVLVATDPRVNKTWPIHDIWSPRGDHKFGMAGITNTGAVRWAWITVQRPDYKVCAIAVASPLAHAVPNCWPTPVAGYIPKDVAYTNALSEHHDIYDLVITMRSGKNGIGVWLAQDVDPIRDAGKQLAWEPIISDEGRKFDRIIFRDMDNDGSIDIVTCEESTNLGVLWLSRQKRANSA